MLDFKQLVDGLLLESDPSDDGVVANIKKSEWFNDIVKKHAALKLPDVANQIDDIIKTSLTGYITEDAVRRVISGVRILDVLRRLFNNKQVKGRIDDTQYASTPEFAEAGKKLASQINTYTKSSQWTILDPEVNKQYEKAKGALDKQAAIALNTYNNLSILEATIQIVKRRTDIFSRVLNLKSPTQPFVGVITDIFKTPEQYLSGQKAVSTDFSEMVDKLYVSDIVNIAIAAKDFYASEMASLKLANTNEPNTQDKENAQLTGNIAAMGDSIDSSNFNNLILNELGVFDTLKQGVQKAGKNISNAKKLLTDPKLKQRYDSLKKLAKQNVEAYFNFISNKPVQYKLTDTNGRETGEVKTTEPGAYTIGKIQNIETTEAVALINSLRSVAQYDRTKPGTGERMAGAQQALQGVAAFGGAKLYT
jgi:hypothetical protein